CWLATIHPARVGALIATDDGVDLDPFIRFGFFLGAAFQIQDDLLNLLGDPAAYGKELCGDIREGKRTLMLIHLLSASSADERDRVLRLYGAPRAARAEAEVVWVRDQMDQKGSIDYAREVANTLAGAALHEQASIFDGVRPSRDRDFIRELPRW